MRRRWNTVRLVRVFSAVMLYVSAALLCACSRIVAGSPQAPTDVVAIAPFPPPAPGHVIAGEQYRLIRERGVGGTDQLILADMVVVCMAPAVYPEARTARQRALLLVTPGTPRRSFYEARVLVAAAWVYVCPEQGAR